MKPDTARFCASFAFVAFTTTLVALFILDVPKPIPHIAAGCLAVMALFIGMREQA